MGKTTRRRPRTALAFDAVGQLNPPLARPLVIQGRVPGGVRGKPYNKRRITTGGYSSVRTGQPSDFLQMQIQQQNTTIKKLQEDAKTAQLVASKSKSELEDMVTSQKLAAEEMAAPDDIDTSHLYITKINRLNEVLPADRKVIIDYDKLGFGKTSVGANMTGTAETFPRLTKGPRRIGPRQKLVGGIIDSVVGTVSSVVGPTIEIGKQVIPPVAKAVNQLAKDHPVLATLAVSNVAPNLVSSAIKLPFKMAAGGAAELVKENFIPDSLGPNVRNYANSNYGGFFSATP